MTRPAPWIVVLVLVAAAGTQTSAQPPLVSRMHRFLMGTSITVEVTGADAATRAAAIEEAFAAMGEVDHLMSNYREDSELTRVNQRAAVEAVPVSAPLMSVLVAAQAVSQRSGGAFDVTVGRLMRLWGFYQKQPHVPSSAELEAIRSRVGYRHLVLDERAHTVRFDQRGVEIDLGGIAKGFAVELAGDAIRRRGLSGFVDAGGNQYFVGAPLGKARWRVGIEDPETQGALLGALDIAGGAVSTSGGYHNFFEAGGRRYGHILDPRTMLPSETSLSVTVVSADATLADALTKPAYILGPVAGLALVESFPGTMAIIASPAPDGGMMLTMSSGLRQAFVRTPHTPRSR